LNAVHELDPFPRVVRKEEVAVEIDVIAQARDLASRGDPKTRFDHAAEHDAEAERACSVGHPDGLPDPA
jgi:hypothetical protein